MRFRLSGLRTSSWSTTPTETKIANLTKDIGNVGIELVAYSPLLDDLGSNFELVYQDLVGTVLVSREPIPKLL